MAQKKLVECDPPVHAVGKRADRPHVGAPVIGVAARDDKLGDHVGRVHGGDQQTTTGRLEPAWRPRQMSRHMDRFEWCRRLRRALSRSWRGVAAGSVGITAVAVSADCASLEEAAEAFADGARP